MDSEDKITEIVTDKGDFYERCLLSAILNNYDFWLTRCRLNINIRKDRYSSFSDFSKPVDNQIYKVVTDFYMALSSINNMAANNIKISKESIIGAIKANKDKQYSQTSDFIESIQNRIDEINSDTPYDAFVLNIADKGLELWIGRRRVTQLSSDIISGSKKAESLQSLSDLFKRESDRIVRTKSEDTKSIDDILFSYDNSEEDDSHIRIPVGAFKPLTENMNGGIKRGEWMLVIAPPGGGKTTISCQLASEMAEKGYKILYITTEQPGSELLPKMVSSGAYVSYSKIMDGFKSADLSGESGKLSASEIKRIKDFISKISKNVYFENWCTSGAKIKSHLNTVVEQHIRDHGVDCVFIDWIGGGIEFNADRGDLKRHFLDESCKIIKDVALANNVAIIACSQASAKKSEDIRFITASEISEHTQMHVYATWALGISCLSLNKKNNKASVNGEIDNKKKEQFFNLFKTRKSKGIAFPVETNFEYSRFEDKTGSINENIIQNERSIDIDVTSV